MRLRPFAVVAGIGVCLLILFLVSVLIAAIFLGGRNGFITGDSIGVVEVTGVILESKNTVKQLHEFRDNDRIKAVVLRVDSPGGVVGPAQEIYEEVRKLKKKKPVIASMGSVAASGGYYVAAPAERIFANPGTVTGSIGVLMRMSNIEGLLGKIGLRSYILKSGKFKDSGSPVRPMTPEDRAVLQSVIDSMHGQFIRAVAEGRKLPVAEVTRIADGRIYSGEQALQLKLVDNLGDLQDAIDEACRRGGIKGKPNVVYPPEKKRFLVDLLMEEVADRIAGVAAGDGAGVRSQFGGIRVDAMP